MPTRFIVNSPPSSPIGLADILSSQPFFNPAPPASGNSTDSTGDNAGFPFDQAAEHDVDPNEEEPAGAEPDDADDISDEAASSDGDDDGADLVAFVAPPDEVIEDAP
ncbi:hypothetical protein CF328_g3289, partial [Tilletia controversa]